MKDRVLRWEIGGFFFIGLVGTALHFVFELSGFYAPVGFIGAVNESVWEHLKIAFWPAVFFALIEYTYIRDEINGRNYIVAKTAALWLNIIIVASVYYLYIQFTGGVNVLWFDITMFYVGIASGQVLSYQILKSEPYSKPVFRTALTALFLVVFCFSAFTYFPPRMFLFEHSWRGEAKGEYGILEDYSYMLIFTDPDYYESTTDEQRVN